MDLETTYIQLSYDTKHLKESYLESCFSVIYIQSTSFRRPFVTRTVAKKVTHDARDFYGGEYFRRLHCRLLKSKKKMAQEVSHALNRLFFASTQSNLDEDFLRGVVEEYFDDEEVEPEVENYGIVIYNS